MHDMPFFSYARATKRVLDIPLAKITSESGAISIILEQVIRRFSK